MFITCPFCKKAQLKIIPVEAFPEEGLVITACQDCDGFWITIPNSEIQDLDGLTIFLGLKKLPLLKRIKMRFGFEGK